MSKASRDRERIELAWKSGQYDTKDLAKRFNRTEARIYNIIAAIGTRVERPDHDVDAMWGMDEDKRRQQIAKRAASGARKTILESTQ
jgi:hypothetical protein